jgi:signal recognition particle subunit SRP19
VRKQDKFIIWPAYFDQSITRKDGRRVSKGLGLSHPSIDEVALAVQKLGLKHEVVADAGYPKTPWVKTGMILVEKQGSKEQVIQGIAGKLSRIEKKPSKEKTKEKRKRRKK